MARRGDGLYLRGKTWYLDACINGTRHQKRLGKGITRSVALELARCSVARFSRVRRASGGRPKT